MKLLFQLRELFIKDKNIALIKVILISNLIYSLVSARPPITNNSKSY